jgi:hypothetical protein
MPSASNTALVLALGATCLSGWVVAALIGFLKRRRGRGEPAADAERQEVYESYKLLMETFNRSNILPWWARVTRTGSTFDWKIRMPPTLQENSIYKLAELRNEGGLWRDEQAPDHERTKVVSAAALLNGADGYQQEFRIIGPDGTHWLTEEVLIRRSGPNEWNLAGVVRDVTKRRNAEEAQKASESQIEKILKGADCLLWQATATGQPDGRQDWSFYLPQSVLYKRIFGKDSEPGQKILWTEEMVP